MGHPEFVPVGYSGAAGGLRARNAPAHVNRCQADSSLAPILFDPYVIRMVRNNDNSNGLGLVGCGEGLNAKTGFVS